MSVLTKSKALFLLQNFQITGNTDMGKLSKVAELQDKLYIVSSFKQIQISRAQFINLIISLHQFLLSLLLIRNEYIIGL
jgi:plasmid replication initiation protein